MRRQELALISVFADNDRELDLSPTFGV